MIPNQDFFRFISKQDKRNFTNLEMLLQLEKEYPGIFVKAMTNFDVAKSHRENLDEAGKQLSWEEALTRFYITNKYEGRTVENADIAEVFARRGLSQTMFDIASGLRQDAKRGNVPEHILGKPIREETVLERIERTRRQTEEALISGAQMTEELYDRRFTYEWLSKNDPHNAIMGILCSCCGYITSQFYGDVIARISVTAYDVQNIVVRNVRGEIIAKGTMYIDKKRGYAVINNFELNKKYRQHEQSPITEYGEEISEEGKQREEIFRAFQRGLSAFIEEYDSQNPNNPLQQINIGMRPNRLRQQIIRFKKATSNLTVPAEYRFEDASEEQYILYQREGIRDGRMLEQEIETQL